MICLSILVLASCDIDVVPDNIATIDNAFTMRNEAEKFLFTCYSYMPKHANVIHNPAFFGGDEMIPGPYYASFTGFGTLYPHYLYLGRQGISTTYMNYWDGYNGGQLAGDGKGCYVAISDCNIFLENIGRVPDMTEVERNRWIAEVKFLKAYFHYWLVKQYGPVVIKDKNISVNANINEVKQYRNTLDECFDYIVGLLDEIINSNHLPDKIENEAEELGRITKAIAMAIKADVLMNAASPLFNANTYYVGLKDDQGVEIFNPNKTEEEKKQRWRDARDACREAIDFAHSLGAGLYYYTSMEYPGLNDDTRAKLNIRMAITDKWNSELIWGDANNWVGGGGSRDIETQSLPRDLDINKVSNTTGRNNHAVPLKIAEQFYTKNGVPIQEDKTWDYANRYRLRTASSSEKYLIKEGYTTASINFDRETRYYADLGFDGGIWFGQGKTNDTDCYYVQAKFGQACANSFEHSWNRTGIWPKKMVHVKTVVGATSGITSIRYPFPVMRLANLYLFYAEALNEIGEYTPEQVVEYVDLVRKRANLKGVKESWTNYSNRPEKCTTQNGLREIIQQERLIELAFEGQRYWDLRRWMRMHTEMPKPLTGWNILEKEATEYYTPKYIYSPSFNIRNYLTPIGEQELRRNTKLIQNYGW